MKNRSKGGSIVGGFIILIIGGHVTQRTLSRTYTISAFMKIRVNHS